MKKYIIGLMLVTTIARGANILAEWNYPVATTPITNFVLYVNTVPITTNNMASALRAINVVNANSVVVSNLTYGVVYHFAAVSKEGQTISELSNPASTNSPLPAPTVLRVSVAQ